MPEPITEQQLAAAFLFPSCNRPTVRRTTEVAPWPWLGGAQHLADEHDDEDDR